MLNGFKYCKQNAPPPWHGGDLQRSFRWRTQRTQVMYANRAPLLSMKVGLCASPPRSTEVKGRKACDSSWVLVKAGTAVSTRTPRALVLRLTGQDTVASELAPVSSGRVYCHHTHGSVLRSLPWDPERLRVISCARGFRFASLSYTYQRATILCLSWGFGVDEQGLRSRVFFPASSKQTTRKVPCAKGASLGGQVLHSHLERL